MYENKFKISAPTVFLDISDLISRNCKPGENIKIELPLKGCAESQAAWQAEYNRLLLKMETTPRIDVTVNQSLKDFVIVKTETEVVMIRTAINNILMSLTPSRLLRQFIPNDSPAGAATGSTNTESAVHLNILYRTLRDSLVSRNLDISSLDAGSDITNNIKSVAIWPQTEEALQFINNSSQYGSTLEIGIRRFIQNGTPQWPLLKAASDMPIMIHFEKHPEEGTEIDFHIKFDWGNSSAAVHPQPIASTQTMTSTQPVSKKLLPFSLSVTVDCGVSQVTHEISHVPCRINHLDGLESEISLSNCTLVSKKHCVLDLVNGQLVLEDLGSTNGTFTAEGKDLRQFENRRYPIQPSSTTKIFLCLGKSERQVRANLNSNDRKQFPQLVIRYGCTPELGEIEGTLELEDEFKEDVVNF